MLHLEVETAILLRREILRLQQELDITMLYVTHDRDEAFSLATRIVVMEHGEIQKTGSVEEISKFISALTFSPRSNYKEIKEDA